MRKSSSDAALRLTAEAFHVRLQDLASESLTALDAIWNEAGYEAMERQSLLGELMQKLTQSLTAEVQAERTILDHAIAQVENKIEQWETCNERLGRAVAPGATYGTNYTERLVTLDRLIGEISVEIAEREAVFQREHDKIVQLCQGLGQEIPALESFRGPAGTPPLSDLRLRLLQEHLVDLEVVRSARLVEMKGLAEQCLAEMADLEIMTEGWETMGDEAKFMRINEALSVFALRGTFVFGFSSSDLQLVRERLTTLQEEKLRRKEELSHTGAEIARLWTLLRIPTAERAAFQQSFKMNLSMETLARGKDELDRLFTIRTTSLKKVITCIRKEIAALWDEAGIESDEQRRREFALYFEDVDLLQDSAVELHEEYFSQLNTRVEELRPILNKIAKREAIVLERIELEHLQMNPERLIARGPNAREERKREEGMTIRVKNLEKFTKELLNQIFSWEERHGPFLFVGERYFERVSKQDENYIELRDSLRNSRKKKDGATLTATASSSSLNSAKSTGMRRTGTLTTTSAPTSAASTPALSSKLREMSVTEDYPDENYATRGINSIGSNDTEYTSMTEIRDRASTATIVRQFN